MNLTRNTKEKCIMARLMRQGQKHQKNFSLAKHGTWEAAERAASKWVNKQKKLLPPSEMNAKGRMSSRNQSGVVGVYLARRTVRKPSGKEYEYWSWCARWPECPVAGGIAWRISRNLSEDDAFALAVLTREMETADRDQVRKKLARVRGRASHEAIMEKKMLALV
jgi:hypothetical protein